MLRTRLLTATAAVALFTAGAALAQTTPIPTPSGSAQTTTGQTVMAPAAPDSTPPAAGDAPDTPAATQAQEATAPAAPAAPTQTAAAIQNNVVDVLRANGQFTTLLAALDAAQLTETLSTQPAISIFAPTDAAFAALPEADRARLMDPANVNELRQVLLYHVVVADVQSSQIEGAKGGVQTAATTEVQLDGTGDAIKVDNATVTTADVDAGNGSVFIIDRVLNPAQSLVASGDAEDATTAPAAEDATTTATPPADEVTPPADSATADSMDADSATADSMDADSATDEGAVAPPPTTPAAPAATMTPTAPATTPTVPSPTTTSPAATTTTTRPATGVNAPNGQPAATTTTVASPTVPNPTDGQVDDADDTDDDNTTPAPAPMPTPQG